MDGFRLEADDEDGDGDEDEEEEEKERGLVGKILPKSF